MRIVTSIVGLVFIAMGVLWILQGAGLVGGSFMTGQSQWLYTGIVTAAVGVVVLVLGRRLPPRAQ